MSDPLLRQWEMLKLIPRERKITVKDLHQKLTDLGFSMSRRTLERDLDRLSIPFCLESDTRSKPYGWRYALNMNSYSLPGLTSSESLTLILLESYLKNMLPVAVADNLATQFAAARQFFSLEHPDLKLQDWLKKIQVVSPGQPLLAPRVQPRIQRTVYDALLHSYQLEMDYLNSGATLTKHYQSVHIQGLVQYGSVIYLVVTINAHQDLRLLALHRIHAAELKDEPSQLLPDFNLQTFIEQGGFGFGGCSRWVTLEVLFRNGAGEHLIDTPLAENQVIERPDLQTLRVTAQVLENPKLLWWLSSFGPDIEIIAPQHLRATLAERHRQAAQQYT